MNPNRFGFSFLASKPKEVWFKPDFKQMGVWFEPFLCCFSLICEKEREEEGFKERGGGSKGREV